MASSNTSILSTSCCAKNGAKIGDFLAAQGFACGCDIVECSRFLGVSERFLQRVFCPSELEYLREKYLPKASASKECAQILAAELAKSGAKSGQIAASLAARFAAKEALAKALGCGICEHFGWQDVGIKNSPAPSYEISEKIFLHFGHFIAQLSLSHERCYALAFCVLLRRNTHP